MSQEATIRRGVRNARYAAIPNHVFEDMRLSMEARWLLGYLLSKPDNWTVVQKDIANKGGCGRDKARKMIAELVDAGYAEKEQARDSGRFGGMSLVIYDEPLNGTTAPVAGAETVAFLPQTDLPATVNPSTVLPSPVNQALVSTDNLENTNHRSERGARDCESKKSQSESLPPEDNRNSAAFEKRVMRLCTGKGFFCGEWQDWSVGASFSWICDRFAELSPQERIEAEKWRDAYLHSAASRKKAPQAIGNFFKGRVWTGLDPALFAELERARAAEATKSTPVRKLSAPYGKMWGAARMAELLAGAKPVTRPSRFIESMIRQGGEIGAQYHREWLMKAGYPVVVDMHDAAKARRGFIVDDRFLAVVDRMEQVSVNSERWHKWRELHEQKGWLWFDENDLPDWIWFPAGGADSLHEFEAALQGLDK